MSLVIPWLFSLSVNTLKKGLKSVNLPYSWLIETRLKLWTNDIQWFFQETQLPRGPNLRITITSFETDPLSHVSNTSMNIDYSKQKTAFCLLSLVWTDTHLYIHNYKHETPKPKQTQLHTWTKLYLKWLISNFRYHHAGLKTK